MKSEQHLHKDIRPLHTVLRQARRAQGISQTALAEESGCTQSAISMMEQGRHNALSKDKLARLAEILQVTVALDQTEPDQPQQGFCPNHYCPSVHLYAAGTEILLWPQLCLVSELHGRYCRYCGEVMETSCRQCKHAVAEGACCRHCGTPYISTDAAIQSELRERRTTAATPPAAAVESRYQHGYANGRLPVNHPAPHA